MKTKSIPFKSWPILWAILLIAGTLGCKKADTSTPTPAKPDYQVAIEAKFALLNWTKDGYTASGTVVQTKGKKGWVQYYLSGSNKRAIYYYPGSEAFGFGERETQKYDNLGQDTFAGTSNDYPLGEPIADVQPCGSGCTFVEFKNGIIINPQAVPLAGSTSIMLGFTVEVHGAIYAKYKSIGRWTGPLGYPVTDELAGTGSDATAGLRVTNFVKYESDLSKTANLIWYTPTTGAQALWGPICKAYRGSQAPTWLKYPTTSCDPNRADNAQIVSFVGGHMDMSGTCTNFYNSSNRKVFSDGSVYTTGGFYPCY
ncbi:LGFP repeat-containing protein [uncultured Fibrella sp.]|uniref:LGFP repeat-containing protein n=1 Tax=uncultured Fibrella sp. TaxID=1284596 RepID=UPI0035C9AF2E